ncbi:MAG: LysR family transcriptional regulator [Gammaproteobacteria bacterium]|nr:MAG: LysR family transcriptional regulator [Gammaproteobacteria bacterium]
MASDKTVRSSRLSTGRSPGGARGAVALPPASQSPAGSRAPINLASVDLNLLTAFDLLLKTGSVSRAADRLGRSQSAMSHTLARLRRLFGDDLFVRRDNRFIPTSKALELAEVVGPTLTSLRMALEGRIRFDPASSQRMFTLAMPDISSFGFLPFLMPALRRRAPGISLSVLDANTDSAIAALAAGGAELAIGYFPELPPTIVGHHLVTLDSVGLADRYNPYLREGTMNLELFLAAPHVCHRVGNDPDGGDFDRLLNTYSYQRRIVLQLPHFLAIPAAIRGTDLVGVVERQLVERLPDRQELVAFELPVPQPHTGVSVVWHQRHEKDPGHHWLRSLIQETSVPVRRCSSDQLSVPADDAV